MGKLLTGDVTAIEDAVDALNDEGINGEEVLDFQQDDADGVTFTLECQADTRTTDLSDFEHDT